MSIDYSKVTGLSDHIGNIVKITDAAGNVLWSAEKPKPVVLGVKKITATTYAGETSYADETFILLDIYPKTNGTVKVTYGGLTKTITDTSGAEEPNAVQVFFGTLNGVSDSVETPASGKLVIEGEYSEFSVSTYGISSKGTEYCDCIVEVNDFGSVQNISAGMFRNCTKLVSIKFPENMQFIGSGAFESCTSLVISEFPEGLISIGEDAFYLDDYSDIAMGLKTLIFPSTLESIGDMAFATSRLNTDHNMGYLGGIVMRSPIPPTIYEHTFGFQCTYDIAIGGYAKYGKTQITVPKGSVEAYNAAEYWRYGDIAEGS